jgi:hypothetical protein
MILFDGKQLYTAQDNTFAGAGRVGLWTKADSVTYSTRSLSLPWSEEAEATQYSPGRQNPQRIEACP